MRVGVKRCQNVMHFISEMKIYYPEYNLTISLALLLRRSVANRLSELDQQRQQDMSEDVEMASIAEDEFLNEKFSLQGTSTGKVSGRRKVVSRKRKENITKMRKFPRRKLNP